MHYSRRPFLFIPFFLAAVIITLYEWRPFQGIFSGDATASSWAGSVGPYLKPKPSLPSRGPSIDDVNNRTLGFQEIKVISMPARTDKHDAWALSASLTGFDFQLVNGVDSASISDKSLPYTMSQAPKVVACWRAHMNVLQDIVNLGVASTLVFEDDADWDVTLKSQLVQLARGSQWLLTANSSTSTTSLSTSDSPYGQGWDFLWIGHCGGTPAPTDPRRFVIPHDPTVEPSGMRTNVDHSHYTTWENASPPDFQTRLVAPLRDAICTAGYAISLEGAKKVLYHMSMVPYDAPVDWGYSDMCRDQKSGFICVGSFPQLIGNHRPLGDSSKYSDIETIEGTFHEAHSNGLVYSTRMNIDRLLQGETVMQSSQKVAEFAGIHEMDIKDIAAAVGHEEEITLEPQD